MKKDIEVISVKISHDGNTYDVPWNQANVYSHSSECDMCGSHGDTEMDVTCPCGKDHSIEISAW